jgi:hypothetical protein
VCLFPSFQLTDCEQGSLSGIHHPVESLPLFIAPAGWPRSPEENTVAVEALGNPAVAHSISVAGSEESPTLQLRADS